MRVALLATLVVLAAVCVSRAAATIEYTAAAQADEIVNLPGLPAGKLPFRQFAGYLTVNATKGRNLFYWFVESERDPAHDPVSLWSNGGPGCSGIIGFMTENGPFQPQKDGSLAMNPNAWNKVANMMFIEAPAGVGFSYSNDKQDYKVGDWRTADDNRIAINEFLKRFPHLATNPFYIASESYGGHYMPTLALSIVQSNLAGVNPKINFRGFAVGNPYTDPVSNGIYGEYPTYWGHQLVSKPTWDQFVQHCQPTPDSQCANLQQQIYNEVGPLDPYALDFPTCTSTAQQRRLRELTHPIRGLQGVPYAYEPCSEAYATTYLNRPEVISAIHARSDLGYAWTDCSNILQYNMTDLQVYMEPLYQQLLKLQPDIKMLIYSGDDDAVCATHGTQYFIYKLGFPITKKWTPWYFEKQVAGAVTHFQGLTFITVHSAGHMVPATQPARALYVWSNFLAGTLP